MGCNNRLIELIRYILDGLWPRAAAEAPFGAANSENRKNSLFLRKSEKIAILKRSWPLDSPLRPPVPLAINKFDKVENGTILNLSLVNKLNEPILKCRIRIFHHCRIHSAVLSRKSLLGPYKQSRKGIYLQVRHSFGDGSELKKMLRIYENAFSIKHANGVSKL